MRRVLHRNTRSCYSNNLTHLIVYKTAFRAENLDPNLAILNERSAVLDAEAMVQQEALCLNGVGNELVEDQVSESREFNQAVGLVRARPASLITVDNSSGLETAVYAMNVEILDSGAIGNLLCSVSDSPNGSKQYICLYDVSSGDGRQIFQSYNRGGIDSVLDPTVLVELDALVDTHAAVKREAICLNGVRNELVEDEVRQRREFIQAAGRVRASPGSLITVDNSSGRETAFYSMNVEGLDSVEEGNLTCAVSDGHYGTKRYGCLYDVSSGDGRQIFQSYNRGGIDSVEFDLSEAVDDAVTEKTDWLDAEKASVLKLVILGYNLNHALTAAFEQLEQSMVLAGKVNEFATRIDIYALGLGSCWITIVAVTTITRLVVYLCHRDTDVGIGARFDSRSLYGHFRDRELQLGDCTLKGRLREEKVGILCERPHFGVMDGNVVGKWEVNELRGQNCGRRVGGQPELCSS
eukprot:CAMPEP_0198367556 /NCGR_PEP_ID=MMETSP1450-20131203/155249_1 /TAXON_ID=753684 ORGANISM="Madagascaria erythrocladiodes, Strain CCMP3234" /NCGR_SAMPLE_ID=MMETSP1450 /ASSEMBLY_ACC=CAM_ASM_001115 /LENGTH=464 /DNA_ID=CAMNT_0044075041 /DNA_START=662 /DNA_END=2056 /DNA_ORIENTATION=+